MLIIVLLLWMQDRDPAGFEQFEIEVRDDLPATIDDAARSRA